MRLMRIASRLVGFLVVLTSFVVCTSPFWLWPRRHMRLVRRWPMRLACAHCAALGRLLGLSVTLKGDAWRLQQGGAKLLVSNHLSYLDVLAFACHFPSCFVTSREIQRTPFLGTLVTAAGCLFVDRQDKRRLGQEVQELADALTDGMHVVVFPEATSTNGDAVLRFRRPLFHAAAAADVPVLPLTLNYTTVDGTSVGPQNRDLICWYGDMGFAPHFLALLGLRGVCAELVVGSPLTAGGDVADLAGSAEQAVRSRFIPLSGPAPVLTPAMEA